MILVAKKRKLKIPEFDWKKFGRSARVIKGTYKIWKLKKKRKSLLARKKRKTSLIGVKKKNNKKKKKKQLTKKEFFLRNKIKRKLYFKRLFFKKKLRLTKKFLGKKKKIFFFPRRPRRLEKKTDISFELFEKKKDKRFNNLLLLPLKLQKKLANKNTKPKAKRIIVKMKPRLRFRRFKRKLRRLNLRKYFFREKQILLDLILATNLFLGKRQRKKQIQNDLMRNYMIAIRNKHAIYNVNMLMINLRRVFHIISNIYFYKQLIMLNLISQPKILAEHVEAHITNMSRPTFMVAQTKWVGGALTNYKDIYKRLYSNLNKQQKANKDLSFATQRLEMKTLKLPRPPQLPSLLFSAGECHWALNEAKKLKLKTVQCVESYHTTYFADINIAVSVSQFPLIMLVSLLKEACIFGNLSFKKYTRRSFGKRRFFKRAKKQIKRALLKKLK